MKSYRFLLIAFGVLCGVATALQSQSYTQLMQSGTNFYQVQKIMNDYWATHNTDSVRGWKQFRRWEDFWAPRVYPTGEFPDGMHIWNEWLKVRGEYNMKQRKGANTTQSTPAWRSLGPSEKVPTNGGAGRLHAIRFDPTNTETIWVGAPAGGLWKTTDLGENWTTTTDSFPNLGVTDIAINPKNTKQMFISTGDGDGGNTNSYGVMRSDDGGKTWVLNSLGFSVSQGRQTSRLLIHPNTPNILLCATSNGVLRTTNSGQSWATVQSGNFKDLEFKPGAPNTVYACAGVAIYKSTDAGSTWTKLAGGLPTSGVNRIALGVTPANPSIVYALMSANNNGFYGLYRSEDEGNSWTRMSNSPNILGWSNTGSDAGGQGSYDLSIVVSEEDPDIVFCGGVNIWRSTDGGNNWKISAHWEGNGAAYVHADCHVLEPIPGEKAFCAGTDGGIFYTTSYGDKWTDISHGLQLLQFYRIGANPTDPKIVIGGCQDNGTNRYANGDWMQVNGADGMEAMIEKGGQYAYSTYYYGTLFRSSNGGLTFKDRVTPPNRGAWITPYLLNPVKQSTIYSGMGTVYRSFDRGANWSTMAPTNTFGTQLAALAMSAGDTNKLYAASTRQIWITTNSGSQWTVATGTLPVASASISNIAVHPSKADKIVATFSGYSSTNKVFISTNRGADWTDITKSGLPAVPVNCAIFYSDKCGEYLFVGTDLGVFYTTDASNTWIDYNEGLPNVIIRDFDLVGNLLRVGTYGRGLWEVTIETPVPVAKFSVAKSRICAGDVVQYFDESGGTPGNVQWEFESGTPAQSTQRSPSISYSTPGTYRVRLRVTNNCGVDSIIKSDVITVLPRPSKPSVKQEGNVLSAPGYISYQWYRNGEAISGATDYFYVVKGDGLYTLRVGDGNGCEQLSEGLQTIVGVEDTESADVAIQLFPNPTRGDFSIKIVESEETELSLRLTSASGAVLEEYPLQRIQGTFVRQLSLASYPAGVYVLEIQWKGKRFVRKIIKE